MIRAGPVLDLSSSVGSRWGGLRPPKQPISRPGGLPTGCECIVGDYVYGFCTLIPGCTQHFFYPDGTEGCQTCDPTTFFPSPVNGVCKCLQGTLVNGFCNIVLGCLVPQTNANGSINCTFCNITAGFQGEPAGGGTTCPCKPHYQLSGSVCAEICGDGYLVVPLLGDCDDGNNLDGDGCSSDCQIERDTPASSRRPSRPLSAPTKETPSTCL
jgi:cysteine-rich repeat protein